MPRIPDDAKLLKDGDIVNIDVTVSKMVSTAIPRKCLSSVSRPYGRTSVPHHARKPVPGAAHGKPGINLREIGAAIQKFVEAEASPSFVNIADTVLVAASMKTAGAAL